MTVRKLAVIGMIAGLYAVLTHLLAAISFLAAWLTRRAPHPLLAPLPPVVVNAAIVGYYLARVLGLPFPITVAQAALGQLVACYLPGYPLAARPALLRYLNGEG